MRGDLIVSGMAEGEAGGEEGGKAKKERKSTVCSCSNTKTAAAKGKNSPVAP